MFAVAVVWGARAYGRSIVFAFGVNWVLMVWAIMFASNVVPPRLPAQYCATRPFEKAGRVYNLLGVRLVPVSAAPCTVVREPRAPQDSSLRCSRRRPARS